MGVKSLWSLLTPVGRPVMLETMEGKVMAIDSSIWIYQFQATMRDKEGRALTNAHVLGFLRRISKLLFYGIKPVFVFDGGAPALKRSTLNERRKKKSGAAVSHAKLAEKLLAAQLRKEALNHATKGKEKARDLTDLDDPNTVYLEDIDGSKPKTPTRPQQKRPPSPSSSTKKGRFHDHDPYALPDVDLDTVVTQRTHASAPDPRLATEDELRAFIEDMRPEDFDVTSPAFRELPTEVQYEIIGDLRLKSRQTSFARLQKMLKVSKTPLDFSKQQILNLKQRNNLTQQLLVTTDTIGSAHISIPVRIASERNKEYVLVKNDDVSGGWILGVKDTTGSRPDKPIEIDQDEEQVNSEVEEEEEDSDEDMEEVEVPAAPLIDPDLAEYQRENALNALSKRNTSKGLEPISRQPKRKRKQSDLFAMNDSDLSDDDLLPMPIDDDEDDESLAVAIQASLDQSTQATKSRPKPQPVASSSRVTLDGSHSQPTAASPQTPERRYSTTGAKVSSNLNEDMDDMYVTPSRLSTALRFAHSSHSERKVSNPSPGSNAAVAATSQAVVVADSDEDLDMEPVEVGMEAASRRERLSKAMLEIFGAERPVVVGFEGDVEAKPPSPPPGQPSSGGMFEPSGLLGPEPGLLDVGKRSATSSLASPASPAPAAPAPIVVDSDSDESEMEMEEVPVIPVQPPPSAPVPEREATAPTAPAAVPSPAPSRGGPTDSMVVGPEGEGGGGPSARPPSPHPEVAQTTISAFEPVDPLFMPTGGGAPARPSHRQEAAPTQVSSFEPVDPLFMPASRSPSPPLTPPQSAVGVPAPREHEAPHDEERDVSLNPEQHDESQREHEQEDPHDQEDFDAAAEMDAHAEQGEFARFLSQVKGRDLHQVRKEIDNEIAVLNDQRRAAARDAEDVSGQMVSQIMMMLRLFGIPYITAPMEAEAQCAELASLRLVDGVITDDSDAFLFGASRVFKNMFNQSKTVECFLATDLERELGLDRDTLVQLAYLLGSDYTEGLQGVGPVVAMELLKEFPGKDGLWRFREWWGRVQSGKDKEGAEGEGKFRRMFKKKFKDLYLDADWPSSIVRDAYYHPTVDSSTEPFKWGLPDLDGLRAFLGSELSWSQAKVDDLLLPIIQKMNRRREAGALNKQGNLDGFFGVEGGAGSGSVVPRQRAAYASKRLQQVVADFRKRRARSASEGRSREGSEGKEGEHGEEEAGQPKRKRRRKGVGERGKAKGKAKAKSSEGTSGEEGGQTAEEGGSGASAGAKRKAAPSRRKATTSAKGRGRGKGKQKASPKDDTESGSEFDGENGDGTVDVEVPLKVELRPRPKPRPLKKPSKEKTPEGESDSGDSEFAPE